MRDDRLQTHARSGPTLSPERSGSMRSPGDAGTARQQCVGALTQGLALGLQLELEREPERSREVLGRCGDARRAHHRGDGGKDPADLLLIDSTASRMRLMARRSSYPARVVTCARSSAKSSAAPLAHRFERRPPRPSFALGRDGKTGGTVSIWAPPPSRGRRGERPVRRAGRFPFSGPPPLRDFSEISAPPWRLPPSDEKGEPPWGPSSVPTSAKT